MKLSHLLILSLMMLPTWGWAYPEFIGIGYGSCLTCHYNGQGNGPLNDYGRALLSAEVSSRVFTSNNEEKLSASSGFFGTKQLPWWIRPGIKARNLWMHTNPGGTETRSRSILMQADFNLAILMDPQQKLIFVGGIGYQPKPATATATKTEPYISREHYVRWRAGDPLWVYMGFMDKTYGLRIVNHTAFSRAGIGLGQNDQSHGAVLHYVQPTWELTANPFLGNLYKAKASEQQRGIAVLYDREWSKDIRVGASVLSSSSKILETTKVGAQVRAGIGYGAAVLLDAGLLRNHTPSTDVTQQGYYVFSQMSQRLARGYHLFFVGQANKKNMKATETDFFKAGAGLLMFPFPRLELRAEVENTRSISPNDVSPEGWLALVQAHLSL
ncbi:MAG: hypothetical protein AB7N80_02985 [Bdellovibrionales bacterium]